MEVLEPIEKHAKKTYKKHKTGKTLGVAPYLNKKLKERTIGEKTFYPVYWQITFNGMNTQIKSESFPNFGVTEFDFSNDISFFASESSLLHSCTDLTSSGVNLKS